MTVRLIFPFPRLVAQWLKGMVRKAIHAQRAELRQRSNRVLPFNELTCDPSEKAKFLGFGAGTTIFDSSYVFGDVSVGTNSWIGPFTVLDGAGGLRIGDNCTLSAGAQIYTHDSVQSTIDGRTGKFEYAAVTIGNNCYIGPNAIIARGVVLGDRCVVGANSYVNQSFGPNSKLAGSPARLLA